MLLSVSGCASLSLFLLSLWVSLEYLVFLLTIGTQGRFRVLETEKLNSYPAKMDLRDMFRGQEYVVRVYCLRGRNLVRASNLFFRFVVCLLLQLFLFFGVCLLHQHTNSRCVRL